MTGTDGVPVTKPAPQGDDGPSTTTAGEDDGGTPSLGRRRLLVGAAAAGVLGAGGVLGWLATGGRRRVTVGGSLPLSGRLADIGEPLRRGLALWVATANDRAGPLDPRLELRLVDDGGSPEEAADAYESLVTSADLLVAPYGSPATRAVVDVVEEAGVPCVAPTAGDRDLWTDGRDWTVQLLNPVDTFLLPALAAARRAGLASVGFVYRADGFTPRTMDGAISRALEGPWDHRAAAVYGDADEIDGAMAQVLAEEPDLLVGGGFRPGAAGGGFLPDALALARAHRRADRSARLVCWSIGATLRSFAERLDRGVDGTTGVTGWKPYVGYPGNGAFVSRYGDRWDGPPDAHAAQGYATGEVLGAALERGDGTEPASVRDALFALETTTVFGRYRVDERGLQTGKENTVVQWQDGTPTVVWPERWRSGTLET